MENPIIPGMTWEDYEKALRDDFTKTGVEIARIEALVAFAKKSWFTPDLITAEEMMALWDNT